jgi:dTDP-4-amino-4,6-dideoxygalactose transaminase
VINDARFVARAEILREKGTNRSRFFRGEIDRYTWVDVGSSYLPSDLLAAYRWAQLEARDEIQRRRLEIWDGYARELAAWAMARQVQLPTVPEDCTQPGHLFYLLLPSLKARTAFIQTLRSQQILTVFHYQPLHLSEMGQRYGGRAGQCPVTEAVADRLVRLPLYFQLTAGQHDRVIRAVRASLPLQ